MSRNSSHALRPAGAGAPGPGVVHVVDIVRRVVRGGLRSRSVEEMRQGDERGCGCGKGSTRSDVVRGGCWPKAHRCWRPVVAAAGVAGVSRDAGMALTTATQLRSVPQNLRRNRSGQRCLELHQQPFMPCSAFMCTIHAHTRSGSQTSGLRFCWSHMKRVNVWYGMLSPISQTSSHAGCHRVTFVKEAHAKRETTNGVPLHRDLMSDLSTSGDDNT